MHQGGDAEPCLGAKAALLSPQPCGPLDGIDRPGAVDACQVTDPVGGGLLQAARGRHLTLHRCDHRATLIDPEPHELGELLLQGHARVQRVHPLGHLRHAWNDGHKTFSFN